MNTKFDEILPKIVTFFNRYLNEIQEIERITINRDLWGRIRLILSSTIDSSFQERLTTQLIADLQPHCHPKDQFILLEDEIPTLTDYPKYQLESFENVFVMDRQLQGLGWSEIEKPVAAKPPRLAFYSIKGGVGRSTSIAIYSWHLARQGKKVLVFDLDLESPGLSSMILSDEHTPVYGICDWLIEELVGNGEAVVNDIMGRSDLATNLDGDIWVIPAHGKQPGEYLAKLGRVFLSLPSNDNQKSVQHWYQRLNILIDELVNRYKIDVILLDSRAGIDDTASSIVTDLGAHVLLFAIDSQQTWKNYQVLFKHWLQTKTAREIRERLQIVAALIPETDRDSYINRFVERSWDLFSEIYDEILPGEEAEEKFNFSQMDEDAPHYPCNIYWNRGFAALKDIYSIDAEIASLQFASFIRKVDSFIFSTNNYDTTKV